MEALRSRHDVVAVVTQPDRPAHRGQRLTAPPVKDRATRAGIPVLQPPRVRDPGWADALRELRPDVAVVVAFGQILPRAVLDVPTRGSINVHASLLPRHRGAAPIAWAIMQGDGETGITTFQMDEGMDTGPMLLQRATPIAPDETAGELAARLAMLGADVLIETLERLDTLTPMPQPPGATHAPRLRKSDGRIDWSRPAPDLANLVRGCNPWPGAHTKVPGGTLTLWRARVLPGRVGAHPGELVTAERGLAVATGDGMLLPVEVQPENRRALPWADYLRGARLEAGMRLESP